MREKDWVHMLALAVDAALLLPSCAVLVTSLSLSLSLSFSPPSPPSLPRLLSVCTTAIAAHRYVQYTVTGKRAGEERKGRELLAAVTAAAVDVAVAAALNSRGVGRTAAPIQGERHAAGRSVGRSDCAYSQTSFARNEASCA